MQFLERREGSTADRAGERAGLDGAAPDRERLERIVRAFKLWCEGVERA